MHFSTKAEYGLRAIIRLAKNKGKKPYSLAQIAKEEGISLAYLERLIAKLKRVGLVKSTKGVKGGYKLACNPRKITATEILVALEGPLTPYGCTEMGNFLCTKRGCATKKVWDKLRRDIIRSLDSITLNDLI